LQRKSRSIAINKKKPTGVIREEKKEDQMAFLAEVVERLKIFAVRKRTRGLD